MHACIGQGNGNPLQCSCLENSRDGGAWWAAIYGVAQSRTRLKRLSNNSSSSSWEGSFSHISQNFNNREKFNFWAFLINGGWYFYIYSKELILWFFFVLLWNKQLILITKGNSAHIFPSCGKFSTSYREVFKHKIVLECWDFSSVTLSANGAVLGWLVIYLYFCFHSTVENKI